MSNVSPDQVAEPMRPGADATCAHCRRPFAADEDRLLLMRDGAVAAAYHERCHPHFRRSGCSAC